LIRSKSDVAVALRQIEELDAKIAKAAAKLQEERGALKEAVDEYVMEKVKDGQYEDDTYKLTRTQGHTRTWNVDKLEAILPRALFKRVIKITVDGQKVDELVRAKKIDRKKIRAAFEERPNKPYVKHTKKAADDSAKRSKEAESLAEKLS
jgi:hypothetical protein